MLHNRHNHHRLEGACAAAALEKHGQSFFSNPQILCSRQSGDRTVTASCRTRRLVGALGSRAFDVRYASNRSGKADLRRFTSRQKEKKKCRRTRLGPGCRDRQTSRGRCGQRRVRYHCLLSPSPQRESEDRFLRLALMNARTELQQLRIVSRAVGSRGPA